MDSPEWLPLACFVLLLLSVYGFVPLAVLKWQARKENTNRETTHRP